MAKTISFRCDDVIVQRLAAEVERSGTTKSDILVRAVKELLYRLACERDAEAYTRAPMAPDEIAWSNEHWIDDEPGTDWTEVFPQ